MTRPGPGILRDVGGAATGEPRVVEAPGAPHPSESAPRRRMARHRGPLKILFLSANTEGNAALALDEEYRAIEKAIRGARHRDAVQLIAKLAARRGDLQEGLLDHAPAIVHISCHGTARAELLLLRDGDGAEPVPADALRTMFGALGDRLQLVVLNACLSSAQADAIRDCAGFTIGMRAPLRDEAAIAFAASLYSALAYGRTVQEAFDLGRAALDAHDQAMPQLFHSAALDPRRARLITAARPIAHSALVLTGVAAAAAIAAWSLRPTPATPAATAAIAPPATPAATLRDPRLPAAPSAATSSASPATAPSAPASHPAVRGMVRFDAAEVRRGVFDLAARPSCPELDAHHDCAELATPERVAARRVVPFELDVQEVSNAELAAWLNADPTLWQADEHGVIATRRDDVALVWASPDCFGGLELGRDGRVAAGADKRRWPAVCVTWYGADAYCRAQGKRLPHADEWELAAKGSDGRAFPWGNAPPEDDAVSFRARHGAGAHPRDVASARQDVSPQGVHDLGGNVAEWTADHEDGDTRIIRGGSWASRDACGVLGSSCKHISADSYGKDVGFRCASSVIEPAGSGGSR